MMKAAKRICFDKSQDAKLERDISGGAVTADSPWCKIARLCSTLGVAVPALAPPDPGVELKVILYITTALDPSSTLILQETEEERHANSLAKVLEYLEGMSQEDRELLTNGKVLEVMDLHETATTSKLLALVIAMAGIHPDWQDKRLKDRSGAIWSTRPPPCARCWRPSRTPPGSTSRG